MRREVFYEYDEYIGGSCHEMLFFFDTFGLVTHYIPSHPPRHLPSVYRNSGGFQNFEKCRDVMV